MAPRQNKKKTSNTQKKKNQTQKQMSVKESGAVQDEIILVVALVVSILLFLSNFDLSGAVGKAVSGIIFGLIGLEAFILPFIIFFLTAFHISNLGSRKAGRKIISALVFFITLAAFIQMLTSQYDPSTGIFDYFKNSSDNRNGGGILGGILVMIFCSLFDPLASSIIFIAVMLIAITVITGKAIFTYLADKSKSSLKERMEYQRLKKEQQEEQQEELDLQVIDSDNGRRPPKTFVLDPTLQKTAGGNKNIQNGTNNGLAKDSSNKLKDQKLKKELPVNEDELPILNFHNLFEDEVEDTINFSKGFAGMENSGPLPTYEEELRNKFGHSDYEEDVKDQPSEVIKHETEVIKKETRVEQKPHQGEMDTTDVEDLGISQTSQQKEYILPPTNLLTAPKAKITKGGMTDKELKETAMKLQSTFESFGVHVTITNASVGPAVTRYELQPELGVKVSRITSLADDIKLNLAAADIRIEAPIPGKAAVGIEVPNKENSMVAFREMIESKEFTEHPSGVAFAVGKDIGGQTIITDIAKMPHLLIAGATGSGKSVCINTLIMSILYKSKPSDVRLIMVDPKVVELNVYNGIPHLLIPVVTDPKKASAALNWAVMEMTERYKKFADVGARDLKGYNEKVSEVEYLNDENYQKLPQIVIIIDELADLMMVAPGEVEDAICRLAQLARAAGLHLIIATQRPSVNVITGVIKANIPSRIAFAVSSAIDSRTIIDGSGAEKLLGKGDMLFFPSGYPKPVRIQGAFISDKEVSSVVEFLKKNNSEANYSDDIHDKINNAKAGDSSLQGSGDGRDEYFEEAGKFIIEKDKASIGMLQRVYKIGFNRAARIMDQLAEAGVVGAEEGTKPRKILMSQEQFEQYLEEY
ncbi:MAG TPA: DNA translocase FtsK [Mobilitalea sp.]|nr:DNA translocase FtsK [Mobilitalea sp.]